MTELSGILPVDKPEGPTSHDVVGRARRALRTRRIGHTGTLDPFASGLLLLCVGPATRLAEYFSALPKHYRATLRLGQATDTDDRMGELVSESDTWRDLSRADIESALLSQVGTIQQLPPVYSAKKVGGERMYAAARRGEEVTRTPVEVTIFDLQVLRVEPPEVEFEVHCSSGTYIRAIARDAGESLGTGAHLVELRRTRVGRHSVEGALSLEQLDDADAVARALLPPAEALTHLPRLVMDDQSARALAHGRGVPAPESAAPAGPVALVSAAGELLAVGERAGGLIQPRKVFV